MNRIIPLTTAMVVMMIIGLIMDTGSYRTVKSTPSIIFDPLSQLCEYNSYWFGIFSF